MSEVVEKLQWGDSIAADEDGTVQLTITVRGFVVKLVLDPEYEFGGEMVLGHEDECLDAFDALGRFVHVRRIAAYRLLDWARRRQGRTGPTTKVRFAGGDQSELKFDIDVNGTRVPVLIRADLQGFWPGEVGVTTDGPRAWAAYNACIEYMLEHRLTLANIGFDVSVLDPHPNDPVILDK